MIVYHSGMEVINKFEKRHYEQTNVNIMTTFHSFQKGKIPKLLIEIKKHRKNPR